MYRCYFYSDAYDVLFRDVPAYFSKKSHAAHYKSMAT